MNPTLPPWIGCDTRSILKLSRAGLNSEFSISQSGCLSKAKNPSLPFYLPIAGGRQEQFESFLRAYALSETQTTFVQDLNSGFRFH